MSSFGFNTTVSSQEADALKEMIFKRARERAQALTQDVQNDYTSSVQNDIMDLARDSFVSARNPFSENTKTDVLAKETSQEVETREIGFAKRQVNELKSQIVSKNIAATTDIANNEIDANMHAAKEVFSKKTTFMGALDFLNSQASIALIKNKGKKFEALV